MGGERGPLFFLSPMVFFPLSLQKKGTRIQKDRTYHGGLGGHNVAFGHGCEPGGQSERLQKKEKRQKRCEGQSID